MFDFHIHSRVSFDGHDTGLQLALAARDKGLKEICFTDHMDYEPLAGVQTLLYDLEEYGRLSFESGRSSIYNWETGSPELKELYEIMTRTDGIYGGRFSGAGFKGCTMALIDPAYEEKIVASVTREYLKSFPELEGKYSVHICESADGVKLS